MSIIVIIIMSIVVVIIMIIIVVIINIFFNYPRYGIDLIIIFHISIFKFYLISQYTMFHIIFNIQLINLIFR